MSFALTLIGMRGGGIPSFCLIIQERKKKGAVLIWILVLFGLSPFSIVVKSLVFFTGKNYLTILKTTEELGRDVTFPFNDTTKILDMGTFLIFLVDLRKAYDPIMF